VPIGIVDLLEQVQIRHDQRERAVLTPNPGEFPLQNIEKCAMVEQSGQPILDGSLAQSFTGRQQVLLLPPEFPRAFGHRALQLLLAAQQMQQSPAPHRSNQSYGGGGGEGAKPPGAPPRRLDSESEHNRLFAPCAPAIARFHLQPVIVRRQPGKLHLVQRRFPPIAKQRLQPVPEHDGAFVGESQRRVLRRQGV